jgi:hypothetical protein
MPATLFWGLVNILGTENKQVQLISVPAITRLKLQSRELNLSLQPTNVQISRRPFQYTDQQTTVPTASDRSGSQPHTTDHTDSSKF